MTTRDEDAALLEVCDLTPTKLLPRYLGLESLFELNASERCEDFIERGGLPLTPHFLGTCERLFFVFQDTKVGLIRQIRKREQKPSLGGLHTTLIRSQQGVSISFCPFASRHTGVGVFVLMSWIVCMYENCTTMAQRLCSILLVISTSIFVESVLELGVNRFGRVNRGFGLPFGFLSAC